MRKCYDVHGTSSTVPCTESMQLDDVRTKAAEFETVILNFRKTLPVLPLRAPTTRARLPAAQAAMKRRGKFSTAAKKTKEGAAPRSMQHRASSARAASGSSSSNSADVSDACEYGFHYGNSYGSSETDDFTSDDQY
jgi:hypothetical protein